jgi:hypothetical protein
MKGKTSIVGITPKERGWSSTGMAIAFSFLLLQAEMKKASILSNNNGFLIAYMKRKATLSD